MRGDVLPVILGPILQAEAFSVQVLMYNNEQGRSQLCKIRSDHENDMGVSTRAWRCMTLQWLSRVMDLGTSSFSLNRNVGGQSE